jgi:hypothetical protein
MWCIMALFALNHVTLLHLMGVQDALVLVWSTLSRMGDRFTAVGCFN